MDVRSQQGRDDRDMSMPKVRITRLFLALGCAVWSNIASACPFAFPAHRSEFSTHQDSETLREYQQAELVAKVRAESEGPSPSLIIEAVFKGRMKKGQRLIVSPSPCAPFLERGEVGIVMLRDVRRITTELLFLHPREIAFLQRRRLLTSDSK